MALPARQQSEFLSFRFGPALNFSCPSPSNSGKQQVRNWMINSWHQCWNPALRPSSRLQSGLEPAVDSIRGITPLFVSFSGSPKQLYFKNTIYEINTAIRGRMVIGNKKQVEIQSTVPHFSDWIEQLLV